MNDKPTGDGVTDDTLAVQAAVKPVNKLRYSISSINGKDFINAYDVEAGEKFEANSESNPSFKELAKALLDEDWATAKKLFDPGKEFERLGERIVSRWNKIFYDNDPIDDALSDHIIEVIRSDQDAGPTLAFLDSLYQNPQEHSRQQLYRFISSHGIDLAPDGKLIFYKGVKTGINGGYQSSHNGDAIVDGKEYKNTYIPNKLGSTVEMPRSKVVHDPRNACSTGLHVGTKSYAKSWATGALFEVHVAASDVVSVPNGDNEQKVRVCRYKIVKHADGANDNDVSAEKIIRQYVKNA